MQVSIFLIGIIIVISMCAGLYPIAKFFGATYVICTSLAFALLARQHISRGAEKQMLRDIQLIERQMRQDIHDLHHERETEKKVVSITSRINK